MKTLSLLTSLLRQGVKFQENGSTLKVVTLKGVLLADALKAEIHANRDEILARLQTPCLTVEAAEVVFPGAIVVSNGTMSIPPETNIEVCFRCNGQRWWVSRYGIRVCERCFPSASPAIVMARIASGERKAA